MKTAAANTAGGGVLTHQDDLLRSDGQQQRPDHLIMLSLLILMVSWLQ